MGETATHVSAGWNHTCALLTSHGVRCWGHGDAGKLGYGNETHIGDNELPVTAGPVDLGGAALELTIGPMGLHTCARLQDGTLRCWGNGQYGRLGYGNQNPIGDDETPASAGNVPVL